MALTVQIKRRAFIARSTSLGLIALAGPAALKGCGGSGTACVDPGTLSASERQMRVEREYTQAAPDVARRCEGCQFFHADAAAQGCGRCEILRSAVAATGWCNVWTGRS